MLLASTDLIVSVMLVGGLSLLFLGGIATLLGIVVYKQTRLYQEQCSHHEIVEHYFRSKRPKPLQSPSVSCQPTPSGNQPIPPSGGSVAQPPKHPLSIPPDKSWHRSLTLIVVLLFSSPALSQELKLGIKGDVVVVKVDRIIVVKEDRTVVKSFPFTIDAPPGSALYFWTFPAGVQAMDKGDRLEVTKAPNGPLIISVKVIAVDFDKKEFVTKFGSISFDIGDPTPPDPPKPPEPPKPDPTDTPLVKILRAAYANESAADRIKLPALIIALQKAAGAANDLSLTTPIAVNKVFVDDLKANVSPALPNLRAAISADLNVKLPREVSATLTGPVRRQINLTFEELAKALQTLK